MFNISVEDIKRSKEELRIFGFTVLKRVIDVSFLKKMEHEAIKFSWANIGKAEINVIETENKCILSSSHNLSESLKIYSNLYNSTEVRNLYHELIGNSPNKKEKINSSYFFKTKESREIKIHQDNAYFNLYSGLDCLTFYIPIHHQSKSRGTIFYFSGSHLLGDLEHVPNGNLGASMCIKQNPLLKDFKINYLNLKPGDIAIHNALVVHGTLSNPKSYLCEAFNFTLFGEFNKINSSRYQDYKNKLEKFLKTKKTIN